MVNAFPPGVPRMSCKLDSIVVSCASQTSSEHRLRLAQASSLVVVFAELYTMQDYDRLEDSFVTNWSSVAHWKNVVHDRLPSVPRSWLRQKLDGTLWIPPTQLLTVLDAADYGEVHLGFYGKLDCIMKSRNIFICDLQERQTPVGFKCRVVVLNTGMIWSRVSQGFNT